MDILNPSDRVIIESSQYDPLQSPGYEMVKGMLVWPDELPDGLSNEGRAQIMKLLIARSLLHHRTPRLSPMSTKTQAYYAEILPPFKALWDHAHSSGLQWAGFHPTRLQLSEADLDYYRRATTD